MWPPVILLRNWILGVSATLIAMLLSSCILRIAFDDYLASYPYMVRLVGTSDWKTTEEAQALLLKRLPVGTPEADVYTFLEANGLEHDRFVGGQLRRYQVQTDSHTILGLISDSPQRLTLFCRGGGFIIWFGLDQQDRLNGITIRSTSYCL